MGNKNATKAAVTQAQAKAEVCVIKLLATQVSAVPDTLGQVQSMEHDKPLVCFCLAGVFMAGSFSGG